MSEAYELGIQHILAALDIGMEGQIVLRWNTKMLHTVSPDQALLIQSSAQFYGMEGYTES